METVVGSGSGVGKPGGPIQLSIKDIEASAATEVAKTYLKVVADTLDIPLLEMDYDARRYQSASNRPVLANVLFSVRVNTGAWERETPEDVWRPTYEELLQLMPDDFRADFLANLQLPPEQRNSNFVIFNNFLLDTAKALAWLGVAAAPVDSESLAAFRADVNLVLGHITLNALIIQSDAFLEDSWAFLSATGPNNPNFDSLTNYLTQYSEIVDDLKRAITLVKDPSTKEEGKALFAETLEHIATLRNEFSRLYAGNDLLILGAYINALALITSAVSLDEAGNTALLIALSVATFGASENDSALGIFGPSFTATVNGLADAILATYLPNADTGTSAFLREILEVSVAAALIFGFIIYGNGFGVGDVDNPTPQWLADKNFAYGIALLFLTNSETLSTIAHVIAKGVDASDDVEEYIKTMLKMLALMMLILASLSGDNPAGSANLIKTMNADLSEGINSISKFVSDALLAGKISGDTAEQWAVYLEQAKIALGNEDYDGFIGALEGCFELLGTNFEAFLGDVQGLRAFYNSLSSSLETSEEDTINTGISNAV